MLVRKTSIIMLLSALSFAPISWSEDKPTTATTPADPKAAATKAGTKEKVGNQWCKGHEADCKKFIDDKKALDEQCKTQSVDKCKELRHQFKEKFDQKKLEWHQQWCAANLAACEQWKVDKQQLDKKIADLQNQIKELRKQFGQKYAEAPPL